MEADEGEPGRLGRLGSGPGGLEPEVVELADRGEPRRAHLAYMCARTGPHGLGCVPLRLREHPAAPCPEVGARSPAAEHPLERMAVRVDEARKRQRRATGDDTNLPAMAPRAVSAPLRQLPNALTILRFVAIPLFVVLLVRDQDGPSWAAGIVFGLVQQYHLLLCIFFVQFRCLLRRSS